MCAAFDYAIEVALTSEEQEGRKRRAVWWEEEKAKRKIANAPRVSLRRLRALSSFVRAISARVIWLCASLGAAVFVIRRLSLSVRFEQFLKLRAVARAEDLLPTSLAPRVFYKMYARLL